MTNREWINSVCSVCAYAGNCMKWLEQEHHCEDDGEDEYETPDDIYFNEHNETQAE